uniref:Secreted protein n=1 Tax=Tetraselmis sp. GSL018 TaxID=582737 RepID=A0A061SCX0_9CHLO
MIMQATELIALLPRFVFNLLLFAMSQAFGLQFNDKAGKHRNSVVTCLLVFKVHRFVSEANLIPHR